MRDLGRRKPHARAFGGSLTEFEALVKSCLQNSVPQGASECHLSEPGHVEGGVRTRRHWRMSISLRTMALFQFMSLRECLQESEQPYLHHHTDLLRTNNEKYTSTTTLASSHHHHHSTHTLTNNDPHATSQRRPSFHFERMNRN